MSVIDTSTLSRASDAATRAVLSGRSFGSRCLNRLAICLTGITDLPSAVQVWMRRRKVEGLGDIHHVFVWFMWTPPRR